MISFYMIVFMVICAVLMFVTGSLTFRKSYLRQKLIKRMTAEEIEEVNKVDLDFWSFLK